KALRKLILFSLLFSLLLLPIPAFGQSNYAVLSGTILDPQQRALPGAIVQLVSVSTHAARHVSSNEQGIFQIPGLLPGDYELNVQASGFAPFTQTLRLEVGQQMTLDINLKLASVTSSVDIQAQAEVLHIADAGVGEVIEPKA